MPDKKERRDCMVIGTGMIAKAFARYNDHDEVLIFASGVSNSGEKDAAQFLREQRYLADTLRAHRDKLIVYFSTCSVDDKEVCASPYVLHKLHMERLIKNMHPRYLVVRLPQVVGRSQNKTTLVNYLYDSIKRESAFTVWRYAVRNIIDVEDVAGIVSHIVERGMFQKKVLNVAAITYPVLDIVRTLEKITQKKAIFTVVEKGCPFEIDKAESTSIAKELHIEFNDGYLERVLSKYYTA